MSSCKIFVDGASRGNPGKASIGVSIVGTDGQEVGKISQKIGTTTNNVAEYSALIAGLRYAVDHRFSAVSVYSDSQLMVRQILGQYKVKDANLKKLWDEAKGMIQGLPSFSIHHVPREQNRRADELANLALDA